MRINVLVKVIFGATILASLIGCGGDDYTGSGTVENPVTINGAKDLILEPVAENSGVHTIDLLKNVVNPEKSSVFIRSIQQIDNAVKEGETAPDNGWVGPPLGEGTEVGVDLGMPVKGKVPNKALVWVDNKLIIDTGYWAQTLADAEKAGADPEIYEYGKYTFSFVIDNGAKEQVERKVVLTVTGVRDDVIGVKFAEEQGFSIPMSTTYQLQARAATVPYPHPIPEGDEEPVANNPKITYSLPEGSPITISETGLITAPVVQSETPFIVVVQSDEGNFTETISGVVSVLSDPLEVVIKSNPDGIAAEFLAVGLGEANSVQLYTSLLPEVVDWNNYVQWSSSADDIVSVSDSGVITGHVFEDGEENTAVITATAFRTGMPDITYSVPVKVSNEASNWLSFADPGFEAGPSTGNWVGAYQNTGEILVTEDAAKDGTYGMKVSNIIPESGAVGWLKASTKIGTMYPQPFDPNKDYKVSFDTRSVVGGEVSGNMYLVTNKGGWVGASPNGAGNWFATESGNWERFEAVFDGGSEAMQKLVTGEVLLQLWINDQKNEKEAYIDNVSITEIDKAP